MAEQTRFDSKRSLLERSLNAYPALVPLLIQDKDPKVRAPAILEVGWRRRRGSEHLIATALAKDADPRLREYAAGALARLGGVEAVTALRKGLADPVLDVRIISAAALLTLGQPVDPQTRKQLDGEASAAGKGSYTSWLWSLQK